MVAVIARHNLSHAVVDDPPFLSETDPNYRVTKDMKCD